MPGPWGSLASGNPQRFRIWFVKKRSILRGRHPKWKVSAEQAGQRALAAQPHAFGLVGVIVTRSSRRVCYAPLRCRQRVTLAPARPRKHKDSVAGSGTGDASGGSVAA